MRAVLPCARAPRSSPAVCRRQPAGPGARRSDGGRTRGGRGARGVAVADRSARGADGAADRCAPLLAARGLRGHRGRVARDPPRGRRHLRPGVLVTTYTLAAHCERPSRSAPASPRSCCWRPPAPSRAGGSVPRRRSRRSSRSGRRGSSATTCARGAPTASSRRKRSGSSVSAKKASGALPPSRRGLHGAARRDRAQRERDGPPGGGRSRGDRRGPAPGRRGAGCDRGQGATRWRSCAGCSASSATAVPRSRRSRGSRTLTRSWPRCVRRVSKPSSSSRGTPTTFPPASSSRPTASSRRR